MNSFAVRRRPWIGGDYRLATAAGAHGLSAYPACLAAHRILGEAFLELGNTDPATRHFEHTLSVDPLNVVARLGLGVASEERKDYGKAYAHYLHAGEINPALDQVRDELVRLRGLLGVKDRLHPTRAGLAGIHVRGGPENARALAILADTERRRGAAGADELVERYRAADPTGDVVALLSEWRPDVDLSFLTGEPALVDDFDFSAHAVPTEQVGAPVKISTSTLAGNPIAGPELWDTLVRDLSTELPSTGVAPAVAIGVEPFARADSGPEPAGADEFADLGIRPFNVDDLGVGGSTPSSFPRSQDAVPDLSTADFYTAALGKDATPAPRPEPEYQASAIAEDAESAILFPPATGHAVTEAPPTDSMVRARTDGLWGGSGSGARTTGMSLGGFDDLAALGIEPVSFAGMPDELPGVDDPSPFAPRQAAPPGASGREPVAEALVAPLVADPSTLEPAVTPSGIVDQFVGADGHGDLTAGWDDLDESLAAATPSLDAVGGDDALAAELGLNGIVPFDAGIPGEDEDAWAPLTDDDFDDAPLMTTRPVSTEPVAVGTDTTIAEQRAEVIETTTAGILTPAAGMSAMPGTEAGLDADEELLIGKDLQAIPVTFDDEVIFGIPTQQASAYPEPRRHVDAEQLASSLFDFSDADPNAAIPVDIESLALTDMADLDLGGADPFDIAELEAGGVAARAMPDLGAPEPLVATGVDGVEPEAEERDGAPPPGWSGSAGLGMAIGSVVWPAFVNQTSDLIDRDRGNGSIFARLRAGKAASVADGQLVVDRRMTVPAASMPTGDVPVGPMDRPEVEAPTDRFVERLKQHPEMSEQTRLDLMAMRVRLIEDADAAEEVAATVENAVGEGLTDPLALRILGEAYLTLGKMEQAAAQFRQAMLARQRTR